MTTARCESLLEPPYAVLSPADFQITNTSLNSNDCDTPQFDEDTVCKKNDENPMWIMFMYAVKHYQVFMHELKEGLDTAFQHCLARVDPIVKDFSTEADPPSVSIPFFGDKKGITISDLPFFSQPPIPSSLQPGHSPGPGPLSG